LFANVAQAEAVKYSPTNIDITRKFEYYFYIQKVMKLTKGKVAALTKHNQSPNSIPILLQSNIKFAL